MSGTEVRDQLQATYEVEFGPGGTRGAGSANARGSGPAGQSAAASRGGAPGDGGTSPGNDGSTPAAGEPGATAAQGATGAPIVIGMDGAWSGLAGGVFAPSRDAVLAWARSVNDRGGIAGHPVEVVVTDNAFNASRTLANIRELVETHHAVALVNLVPAPGTAQAIATYLEERHVAAIMGTTDHRVTSPALFTPATNADVQAFGLAKAVEESGHLDVGVAYCVESTSCADLHEVWLGHARALGLNVVFDARVSTAQPDYTATCVQARSEGATSFVPLLDSFGTVRLIQSCVRQNYRPFFVDLNPTGADAASLPGGTATPLRSFPWFMTSGSPALDEYGQAMRDHVTTPIGQYSSIGWVAAKTLERALVLGPTSETPTPDDVFNGLWAFQDETLGGLTPPLTFPREGDSYVVRCSYQAIVQGDEWTAPLGLEPTYCMP